MSQQDPGPQVSVIIPCYNVEKWIATAVESVLTQDVQKEVIVVDDGSSDSSMERLATFGKRITVIEKAHSGSAATRNVGLSRAKGSFINFLDADDAMGPDYLSRLLQVACEGEFDIIFAGTLNHFEAEGRSVLTSSRNYPTAPLEAAERWIKGDMIQTGAVLWRREFLVHIGGWNEKVRIGDDWELGLRALLNQPKIGLEPTAYAIYNHRHNLGRSAFRTAPHLLGNTLEIYSDMVQKIESTGDPGLMNAIADRIYGLARYAFCRGYPEIGSAALAKAHGIRPGYHQGNVFHRLFARTIGLRRKEMLFSLVRKVVKPGPPSAASKGFR